MSAGIKPSDNLRTLSDQGFATRHRHLLSGLLIILLVLLATLYIGWPTVMALSAIMPDGTSPQPPPDGFSEVTLLADDGVHLAGWYSEPKNGAAVILVHGAGSGKESLRPQALMLQANEFGVLVLSLRGYSGSEGRINRLGWNSAQDIGAAVEYLSERDEVMALGGLGLSMGGEVLLGAASQYPQIQAIVTDGATFRDVDEYRALPSNQPLYRNFTHHVFTLMVRIFSGDQPPEVTIPESVRQAKNTSFLFIASGNDDTEIAYNDMFYRMVAGRSSLWIIPEVDHTGGYDRFPAEYEQRLVDFFSSVLLK
jgi:uncharacterized protein